MQDYGLDWLYPFTALASDEWMQAFNGAGRCAVAQATQPPRSSRLRMPVMVAGCKPARRASTLGLSGPSRARGDAGRLPGSAFGRASGRVGMGHVWAGDNGHQLPFAGQSRLRHLALY